MIVQIFIVQMGLTSKTWNITCFVQIEHIYLFLNIQYIHQHKNLKYSIVFISTW